LTRDPVVCREYRGDPLWQARTTPAFSALALRAIEDVHKRAGQLRTPLLVLHGTADRVVPIAGTRSAFPRFGSTDKTYREITGAFHALPIEPEPDGEQVCAWIAEWLKSRAPA
jgi:alpha-beta hydrolase superfamily lysophospholipase